MKPLPVTITVPCGAPLHFTGSVLPVSLPGKEISPAAILRRTEQQQDTDNPHAPIIQPMVACSRPCNVHLISSVHTNKRRLRRSFALIRLRPSR
jgi:hypothetical protein